MKRLITIFLLASVSLAQEITAELGIYSKFMDRGFNLYDGVSAQPWLIGSYELGDMGSINGDIWSHFSLEGEDDIGNDFTEVDYAASYTLPIEEVGLSVGHIWYTFPRGKDVDFGLVNSNEIFVEAAFEDTLLSPVFTFYSDYNEFKYEYYNLNLSHSLDLEKISLVPSTNLGFASNSEKVYADDGLVEVTLGLAVPLELDSVTLNPNANYTFGIDDFTDDEFWAGIDIGVTF